MNLDRRQLDELCSIAQRAGEEIMQVYAAGEVASWTKADASPLTEADLRADRCIRDGLASAFPGVFVLSEESGGSIEGVPDTFFLVDPLDGTKEFLKRNGEFTVNIALVTAGRACAGVVLAPALGQLYFAAEGVGAFKRMGAVQTPIQTRRGSPSAALRVMGSRSHGSDETAAWLERLASPHTFVAAGSSLKFCRLAEGEADLYPRFGPTCQWDTAAAQAVLEVAGGVVLDGSGHTLRYGSNRPLLNPWFVAKADPELEIPPLGEPI